MHKINRILAAALLCGIGVTLTHCGSREVRLETDDAQQAQKEMLENMTEEERQQFMKEVQEQSQDVDPTMTPGAPSPEGQ